MITSEQEQQLYDARLTLTRELTELAKAKQRTEFWRRHPVRHQEDVIRDYSPQPRLLGQFRPY